MRSAAGRALAELAARHGVALSYVDWSGRTVDVATETVVGVLRALGVDASSTQAPVTSDEPGKATTRQALPLAAPVELPGRAWGWMLQLYALRGAGSWGMGDYRDLTDIVVWAASAEGGRAGLVVCNPLHAVTPVHPIENSPYFPSSRRFRSPLYLRIADLPEYVSCDRPTRARVDSLRPSTVEGRIDRDAVWAAKREALELLWPYARQERLAAFRTEKGRALDDFALFCTLAEKHGGDWREWSRPLRDPRGAAARAELDRCGDRVGFHAWLQLLSDEQLAAAAAAAHAAGMAVGVVHDLAVGVDPGGADAWAQQDVLASGATVGCPPDRFNQRGQDWRLPPWHPGRLERAGYQPFREMVRSVLRHAGGIRVDHVMGLFRLWWVPEGNPPDRGTYVSYDSRALLAVLMQEAHDAGAVVIGEDLGTVEPRITAALAAAGVLGSDVAWFKRRAGGPQPPKRWRRAAMASVTTHDLPTVAGWLTGESLRVRAELGQLTASVDDERARLEGDRAALLALLREEGLLEGSPDDAEEVMLALHRLLVASPAVLAVAAPGDGVGDVRQPNLPGTLEEYPNWRLPLADGLGRTVTVEDLRAHPTVRRLIAVLSETR